jgi:hypothetical protein
MTNLIFGGNSKFGKVLKNHLSATAKEILLNKFKKRPQLIDLVNSLATINQPHSKFWKSISRIDSIRNSNFKSVCPDWANLLN